MDHEDAPQVFEVMPRICGRGRRRNGGKFVGDELIIGRALKGEKGLQELLDGRWPDGAMVAAVESGQRDAYGPAPEASVDSGWCFCWFLSVQFHSVRSAS